MDAHSGPQKLATINGHKYCIVLPSKKLEVFFAEYTGCWPKFMDSILTRSFGESEPWKNRAYFFICIIDITGREVMHNWFMLTNCSHFNTGNPRITRFQSARSPV